MDNDLFHITLEDVIEANNRLISGTPYPPLPPDLERLLASITFTEKELNEAFARAREQLAKCR